MISSINLKKEWVSWSGNTQEEAPWYMDRTGEGWIVISVILIAARPLTSPRVPLYRGTPATVI